MSSWMINPATGDYIMVNGAPVPTDSLTVPAYYRIRIPRLNWMYAPNTQYGSDLFTLKKKTGNAAINMVQNALNPMIQDGRALATDTEFVNPQPTSRNTAALNVYINDALNIPETLQLPVIGN